MSVGGNKHLLLSVSYDHVCVDVKSQKRVLIRVWAASFEDFRVLPPATQREPAHSSDFSFI